MLYYPTLKSLFFTLILSSSSLSTNASSLPSNALNRWKDPVSIRGGETTTTTDATATVVSTKSSIKPSPLTMENKVVKKKRKKVIKTVKSPKSLPTKKSTESAQGNKSGSDKPSSAALQKQSTSSKDKTLLQTTAITPIMTNEDSTTSSLSSSSPSFEKMPSIFTPEESIYDKYSACLSATEGLRRIRDAKIDQNKKFRTAVNVDAERSSGWKSLLKSQQPSTQGEKKDGDLNAGSSSNNTGMTSLEQQKEEYKRACAEYVLNSSKVVKALGLSVSQFNQLGREVKRNTLLKEKVRIDTIFNSCNDQQSIVMHVLLI